jgi:hypothetical protein
VYGYPLDEAAAIALREVGARERDFDRIVLVAFGRDVYDSFTRSGRSERLKATNDPDDRVK